MIGQFQTLLLKLLGREKEYCFFDDLDTASVEPVISVPEDEEQNTDSSSNKIDEEKFMTALAVQIDSLAVRERKGTMMEVLWKNREEALARRRERKST